MKKRYTLLFILFSSIIDARVRTVQTDREFNKEIKRSQMAVVLLYNSDKKVAHKHDINGTKLFKMYESVSDRKLYEDANVTFIKVISNSQAGRSLIASYGFNDYPLWCLFKDDRIISIDDLPVKLSGFILSAQLQDFIDTHFGAIIEDNIAKKNQKENEMIKQSKDEANPYLYPAVMYTPTGDISSWKKPTQRN